MARAVAQEVLLTLVYSAVFRFPLSVHEIHLRCISLFRGKRAVSLQDVRAALKYLVQLKLVVVHGKYYYPVNLPDSVNRSERRVWSKARVRDAHRFIRVIRYIPWVQAVGITGSVAVENARKHDDTDFLILTSPDRLWLSRLVIVFIAFLFGKRRSWHGEEEESWCLNMWLTTDALALPAHLRTVYGAYEFCQIQWVFARGGVLKQFLHCNGWVRGYLPNFFQRCMQTWYRVKQKPLWVIPGLGLLNALSYSLQLWYMRSHKTSEQVGENYALFHPRDTRGIIQQQLRATVDLLHE